MRFVTLASSVTAVLAVLAALAWFDVLPGGYRLRGWVEDHAVRRARLQREASQARLALFAAENPRAPEGAVVFLGSSTIERFPLDELFPGAACLDRGIGNESAAECLARLPQSLPAAAPAGFVLYLASIEFRRLGLAPEQVAARALAVVDALRQRYPDRPMALIGLLSQRTADDDFAARWRAANRALEAAARSRGLAWIDVDRAPLTSSAGALSESHSVDDLHLNAAGYAVLAGWLRAEGGALCELLSAD